MVSQDEHRALSETMASPWPSPRCTQTHITHIQVLSTPTRTHTEGAQTHT